MSGAASADLDATIVLTRERSSAGRCASESLVAKAIPPPTTPNDESDRFAEHQLDDRASREAIVGREAEAGLKWRPLQRRLLDEC